MQIFGKDSDVSLSNLGVFIELSSQNHRALGLCLIDIYVKFFALKARSDEAEVSSLALHKTFVTAKVAKSRKNKYQRKIIEKYPQNTIYKPDMYVPDFAVITVITAIGTLFRMLIVNW